MLRTLHLGLQAGIQETIRARITDRVLEDNASAFRSDWQIANAIPGFFAEANAATFWAVIAENRPSVVVEIGSYLGRSTVLLGLALKRFAPGARLVSIDPHTGDRQQLDAFNTEELPTFKLFQSHLKSAGLENIVDVRVATSDSVGETWDEDIDLLFVDGWHSYDAVMNDSANFASHLSPHGLVCYDDYLLYADVRAAVGDACSKFGLNLYGTVASHAWAGRDATTLPCLNRGIRSSRPYQWGALLNQQLRDRLKTG